MCEASHFGDADPPERTGSLGVYTTIHIDSHCMRELKEHCTAMTKVLERHAVSLILLGKTGSQFVQLDALLVVPSSCIDPYEDEELRWATKNSIPDCQGPLSAE
ncbi:hypothetical protein NEUTE2DRAFT_66718 [Neurospora tetrasperma FGSC 2509]|nr:hypothetical protein NEUTE2DRAFT_66718 [Neurospora tetrasperma FGSC 2509]